ncbi:carboxymuconolactone decarboxylase family protein [Dactylosporangium vinaceum]|uniref:Carboxymuconolactone decarboxylase family protein n=1 Tax=Dactylosporangium vinaceum TaxID=53362 RepID=A0ABV5MEH1_9ACTN|nr:carboxymuconolactone decarboxylase family protein [Dactylosporangium vinaceum]UAB92404.1 carboxymuconolactone decarboxylase family protein [Dactylosporangium vinaceum]
MNFAEVVPEGYAVMAQLEKYGRRSVEPKLLHLVKVRASIVNGCAFCIDMHSAEALHDGDHQRRLFAVAAWRESTLFDARERAAFALTDALTRLGEDGVPDDVWAAVRAHLSPEEAANLVLAIGIINVWNRISIASRRATPPL